MNEADVIRLRKFRQLKEEIRGSKEYLIVGIDVAKEKHQAFFGTANGKTLIRRLFFDNNLEGFRKLLTQVQAIQVAQSLPKVVFGLEPTANYHKPLGEHLIKCGRGVVLISGVAVKNNRALLDGRWDKHDTKDAANVADLVSQGKCQFYEYPEPGLRDLRTLLSLKRKLKKQEHSYRVRIRNQLLAQYFPELDRYSGRPEVEAIIRWCLDPSEVAGLEFDQFVRLVAPGRKTLAQHQRLQTIQQLAVESIGCEMGEGAAFEAQVLVDGLRHIRETIKSTDDQIREICRQFPEYDYLLTIPGFGPDICSQGDRRPGQSVPFSKSETGAQNGRSGSERRSEWENLEYGDPGYFQKGKSRSAVCLIPSGLCCLYPEYGLYAVLYSATTGTGKRERDQDQTMGQAVG